MFEQDDGDNNAIEIDRDEFMIIYDNLNWKPPQNLILAYANQLGFDIENDPPELLSIAEKYLTKDIPDRIHRAFHKETLKLVYIDMVTNEIELSSEFEEMAKEEYKIAKEKLLKDMKAKEIEANKVTVIPRKKIAPIGAKKALEDPIKKREKDFMKEVKKTYKESEKKLAYEDEETKELKARLSRDEKLKNNLFDEDIQNKYKYSDDEIDQADDNNDNENNVNNKALDYDKNHEINSKERKFLMRKII